MAFLKKLQISPDQLLSNQMLVDRLAAYHIVTKESLSLKDLRARGTLVSGDVTGSRPRPPASRLEPARTCASAGAWRCCPSPNTRAAAREPGHLKLAKL